MMWGREAVLPMDVAYGLPAQEGTIHEHLRDMLENIRKAHTIATETLQQSREVQKKYYDWGQITLQLYDGRTGVVFLANEKKSRVPAPFGQSNLRPF